MLEDDAFGALAASVPSSVRTLIIQSFPAKRGLEEEISEACPCRK
jgi:hypothetical protein